MSESAAMTRRRALTVPARLEFVTLSAVVCACASSSGPDATTPDVVDARAEISPNDSAPRLDATPEVDLTDVALDVDASDTGLVFDGYVETAPGVFCSRAMVTFSLCRECASLDARLTACGRCFTFTGNPECVLCFEAGDGGAAPLTHCA